MSAGPAVLGTAAAGKRLTALSGTWQGNGGVTYRFQWYRCNAAGAQCLSIQGATSPSYALVAKDVGKAIGLAVSATDSTGTSTTYASLVGPIAPAKPLLESTIQPVITGPPVEGKTVQVTTGTWSPTPSKVTYTWERCNKNSRVCAAIPRATSSSYTITKADLGHSLAVLVQASYGTNTQNTFSVATPAVVDASVIGPTRIAPPTVSGPAVETKQLTATVGVWKGVGSIAFTYQWHRCDLAGARCSSIHGATTPTYTLGAKDSGQTVALTLGAIDATGVTVAYSSLVGPVASATAQMTPIVPPAISGTAKVGAPLTVDPGQWSTSPRRYVYTWLRCNTNGRLCATIPGATSPTYTPTAADAGHELVADVQAIERHVKQPAYSAATGHRVNGGNV